MNRKAKCSENSIFQKLLIQITTSTVRPTALYPETTPGTSCFYNLAVTKSPYN